MSTERPPDDLFRRARELIDVAGSRTGQIARIARLEIDLFALDRDRKEALARLGERTFDLLRRGDASRLDGDPAIAGFVQRIRELEAERIRRRREIDEIRDSPRRGPGAGGGP